MPPEVSAGYHALVGVAGAAHHHHLFHDGRARHGLVGVLLELDNVAPPVATVGGNQHLRLAVVNSVAQRFGAETPKHHAVGRPNAGAGQHGDGQLWNHGQVNGYPVALFHPQALEGVGEAANLPIQVPVGVHLPIAGFPFPHQGRLVTPRRSQVPVDAVVRYVELSPNEPPGVRRVPVQYPVPLLDPRQLLGEPGPETLRVPSGFFVDLGVGDVGLSPKIFRRRESAVLLKQRLYACYTLRHHRTSSALFNASS